MQRRLLIVSGLVWICLLFTFLGTASWPLQHSVAATPHEEAKDLYRQANAAMHRQDYPQAIALFTRSIELNPNDPEPWNNRGASYQSRGDLNAAYEDYTQTLTIDPEHPLAWVNRANVAWRLGRYDEAWADLDRAETINGANRASIYANRSYVSLMRGEVAQSFQWLWDAIQADPNDASIQEELTRNLSKIVSQEMLDGADARIAADPDDAVAHYDRGYVLMQMGRSNEGSLAFQRAVELDPRFALVYLQIGYYLSVAQKNDQAIGLFNHAIQLDTDGVAGTLARWQRARVCHRTNRNEMAASDAAAAVRSLPLAYQVLCEVARAEHRAGQYDSALHFIDRALTTRPDEPWALNFRAMIVEAKAQAQPAP